MPRGSRADRGALPAARDVLPSSLSRAERASLRESVVRLEAAAAAARDLAFELRAWRPRLLHGPFRDGALAWPRAAYVALEAARRKVFRQRHVHPLLRAERQRLIAALYDAADWLCDGGQPAVATPGTSRAAALQRLYGSDAACLDALGFAFRAAADFARWLTRSSARAEPVARPARARSHGGRTPLAPVLLEAERLGILRLHQRLRDARSAVRGPARTA